MSEEANMSDTSAHQIIDTCMMHLRLLLQVGFSKEARTTFVDNMFKHVPAALLSRPFESGRGAPLNVGFHLRCLANVTSDKKVAIEGTLYAALFWSKTYTECKFLFQGADHPLNELLARIKRFVASGQGTMNEYTVCKSELLQIQHSLNQIQDKDMFVVSLLTLVNETLLPTLEFMLVAGKLAMDLIAQRPACKCVNCVNCTTTNCDYVHV